jgi:uncharacterized protein YjdB
MSGKKPPVVTPGGRRSPDLVHRVAPGQVVVFDQEGKGNVADKLVLTPGGFRSKALVHHVPPRHGLRAVHGELKKVDLATDKLIDIPRAPADAIAPKLRARLAPEVERAGRLPALGEGWITYAWWDSGAASITRFATTWIVPPAPSTYTGQTIFLFNGIQNTGPNFGILQPVLQYGPSAAGGGNFWSIASWYVTSGGDAFHTDLIQVAPGDTLVGLMRETASTTNFDYESSFDGRADTTLPIQNIASLHWANETLEAYAVQQRTDYPATAMTAFTGIDLSVGATHPALTWTAVDQITDCGQHTAVISNNNPGGQVDLWYRAQSRPMSVLVHLENIGDRTYQADVLAGTRGEARRLEGFQLAFQLPLPGLSMRYMAHLQNIGDVPFVNEGQFVGTRGESRRLEGFAIELTGPSAPQFDVSYLAHLQDVGDTAIVRNGEFCGTRGQSRRVEGILVRVTPRPTTATLIRLDGLVHLENVGDQRFHENDFAGTRGQSRRLEGFQLALSPAIPGVTLQYMAHLQDIGDVAWVNEGQFVGTRGQSRRLSGFAIRATGPAASRYDIVYTAHLGEHGDIGPHRNGEFIGLRDGSGRIEGITVWVVPRVAVQRAF